MLPLEDANRALDRLRRGLLTGAAVLVAGDGWMNERGRGQVSNRTIALDERLYDYLLGVSLREPDVLRRLREETLAMPRAGMQIAPEQGQFMALLVALTGARCIVEIGTFTGYSALAMALAMPPRGKLIACDVSAPNGRRSPGATGRRRGSPIAST